MIIKKEDGKTKFVFDYISGVNENLNDVVIEKARKHRPWGAKSFSIIDVEENNEYVGPSGQRRGYFSANFFSLKKEGKHRI